MFDALLNGDLTGLPSLFTNATGFHYYFNYLNTEYVKIVVMMMPRKQNMLSHFTIFLGACDLFFFLQMGMERLKSTATLEKQESCVADVLIGKESGLRNSRWAFLKLFYRQYSWLFKILKATDQVV